MGDAATLKTKGLVEITATTAIAATTPLSPSEIKATFGTGTPFSASSTTGGAVFSFAFKPDGNATQTSKGASAKVINGTCRVNDKGYCTKWGNNPEHCYTVETNGKRYHVRDSAGKIVSRWTLYERVV